MLPLAAGDAVPSSGRTCYTALDVRQSSIRLDNNPKTHFPRDLIGAGYSPRLYPVQQRLSCASG